jgi:hypothetical protein
LTTALFNEGVLLATSLFIVALRACPSSGLCRGVGPLEFLASDVAESDFSELLGNRL